MTEPTTREYFEASKAAYTLTNDQGTANPDAAFKPPEGFKVIARSDPDKVKDGFSAIAMEDKNGNVVIAYEGTRRGQGNNAYGNGSLLADGMIDAGQTPQALRDAAEFAREVQEKSHGKPVYVTGHSLGGIEAEYVVKNVPGIAGGATFGATGLPGNDNGASNKTLTNYVEYGDPVGNRQDADMQHVGKVVMIGNPDAAKKLEEIKQRNEEAHGFGKIVAFGQGEYEKSQALSHHSVAAYDKDLPPEPSPSVLPKPAVATPDQPATPEPAAASTPEVSPATSPKPVTTTPEQPHPDTPSPAADAQAPRQDSPVPKPKEVSVDSGFLDLAKAVAAAAEDFLRHVPGGKKWAAKLEDVSAVLFKSGAEHTEVASNLTNGSIVSPGTSPSAGVDHGQSRQA